jgi:hypothetical protein
LHEKTWAKLKIKKKTIIDLHEPRFPEPPFFIISTMASPETKSISYPPVARNISDAQTAPLLLLYDQKEGTT